MPEPDYDEKLDGVIIPMEQLEYIGETDDGTPIYRWLKPKTGVADA